jgi:hypothetical protein
MKGLAGFLLVTFTVLTTAEAAQAPSARTGPATARKKAASAAQDKDASARKQLRAILEPQTEAMLKCAAIQDELVKLLMDRSITTAEAFSKRADPLQRDHEKCIDDIKTATIARFEATKAPPELQQAVWKEWVDAVGKRHEQEASAKAPQKEKP